MDGSLILPEKDEKSIFIENIKRWVILDSHLKMIQEKTKTLREERHQLTPLICAYLDKNGMISKRIGIHDGDLRVYEKKEYAPLSLRYLEERLGEIIPEKSSVDFILQYLKEHRQTKITSDLRRTYR